MPRTVLFFVLLVVTAGPLAAGAGATLATDEEALLVAQNWVTRTVSRSGDWAGEEHPAVEAPEELLVDGQLVGWCFPVRPEGHVVVPVIKELSPVKAYSDACELSVRDADGFARLLREGLAAQIGYIEERADAESHRSAVEKNRRAWDVLVAGPGEPGSRAPGRQDTTRVGPLLTTAWHQFAPYFNYCPRGDSTCVECSDGAAPGERSAGCVATATAQIMNYHVWPPGATVVGGRHSYVWDGDWHCGNPSLKETLSVRLDDPYAWLDMPDDCAGGSDTRGRESACRTLLRSRGGTRHAYWRMPVAGLLRASHRSPSRPVRLLQRHREADAGRSRVLHVV